MKQGISSDLIRGHTDTIVLGLLSSQDMYGYQVYKAILERSQGQYELKEATLYSSFRRLEEQKWVSSYWGDETQGGRRKYYSITPLGKAVYQNNKADWEFAKTVIDVLLQEVV